MKGMHRMGTNNNSPSVQHGEAGGYPPVQHGTQKPAETDDDNTRYYPTHLGASVATRTHLDRAMVDGGPDGGVYVSPDGRHLGVLRDRGDEGRNDLVRPFADVERGAEPTEVISVGWIS